MWLHKMLHLYQSYKLKRERGAFKSKMETVLPLDLPRTYLDMYKRNIVTVVDRQRKLTTSVDNMREIIDWINSIAYDLNIEARTTQLSPPGTTRREKSVRVDTLLYDTKRGEYITLDYVFRELVDAYEIIAHVMSDKNHPTHYRAKDRIMPHIESLHKLFISIID